MERLSGRRSCPKDGSVYHVPQNPSKREGHCDQCGSSLLQREDDKPEKVRERLAVYARQTAPLEAYYDKQGLLRVINGVGSPEDIYAQIKKILARS